MNKYLTKLKSRLNRVINEYQNRHVVKKQRVDLIHENKALKKQLNEVKTENEALKEQLNEVKTEIEALKEQLNEIKTEIEALKEGIGKSQEPFINQPNSAIVEETDSSKKGYFELVIQKNANEGYFNRILEVKNSEARFECEYTELEAKFKPINFNDIRSYDQMELAIIFTGKRKMEANDMKITNHGVAKLENEEWTITKKAEVELI